MHFLRLLSCLVSINYRQNLTLLFHPGLPTTGPGNKLNSNIITSCTVMLIMTAANIWSCKDTLVCCCERWAHTIQDCTAETWVDYCQLGEDCSLSPEISKLQGSCCLKFCFCGTTVDRHLYNSIQFNSIHFAFIWSLGVVTRRIWNLSVHK